MKVGKARAAGSVLAVAVLGASLIAQTMISVTASAETYVRPGRVVRQLDYISGGAAPNGRSYGSSVSDSGRYVAFDTDIGLLSQDINGATDVYLRDTKTGRLWLASAANDGSVALGSSLVKLSTCAFDPTVPGEWITPLATPLSWDPAISGNGRFVAFVSWAPNLIHGDTNLAADVFVFDRKDPGLERISVDTEGRQAAVATTDESLCPASWSPSMDRTGTRISFTSRADNLDGVDDNKLPDVFIHDIGSRRTERITVPIDGVETQHECLVGTVGTYSLCWTRPGSDDSAISSNGRYVAFDSHATDLVKDDSNRMPDVFVRDLKKDHTERVSVDSSEGQIADDLLDSTEVSPAAIQIKTATGGFISPTQHAISADGRFVVFFSDATDVIPNDQEGTDIYVRDTKLGRTERVSVLSTGEGHGQVPTWAAPSISRDGRFVTFPSYVDHDHFSGLPDDWLNSIAGVVYDRRSGALELVSRASSGAAGRGCRVPDGLGGYFDQPPHSSVHLMDLDANGRYVSMSTCNTNMQEKPDPKPEREHVLLVDRGLPIGFGGTGGKPYDQSITEPQEGICISPEVCIPPLGVVSATDRSRDTRFLTDSTDLIGARIAFRPQYGDLFVVAEVERLRDPDTNAAVPGSRSAFASATVYGIRFTVEGRRYEVRATAHAGGSFGLFDCTGSAPSPCERVSELSGGFGTTGERVVVSLPLESIGLGHGGALGDLEAFTAVGGYQVGVVRVLDSLAIR